MRLSLAHWQYISQYIASAIDENFTITQTSPVAGGDISASYYLEDENQQRRVFVKINSHHFAPLFTAETEGLSTIANTNTLHTPPIICVGAFDDIAFLVLDYIDIQHSGDSYQLGKQLALMHQYKQQQFGFDQDNFIGSSKQRNHWKKTWLDFWISERLEPQLALAYQHGFKSALKPLGASLMNSISELLSQHQPSASLVHGDLWNGNKGFTTDGSPLIFDPACYYGDREVDIAMTRLFGGFDTNFYEGYNNTWPLSDEAKYRRNTYNLYHLLNHLNLFGPGYLSQCLSIINQIIKA